MPAPPKSPPAPMLIAPRPPPNPPPKPPATPRLISPCPPPPPPASAGRAASASAAVAQRSGLRFMSMCRLHARPCVSPDDLVEATRSLFRSRNAAYEAEFRVKDGAPHSAWRVALFTKGTTWLGPVKRKAAPRKAPPWQDALSHLPIPCCGMREAYPPTCRPCRPCWSRLGPPRCPRRPCQARYRSRGRRPENPRRSPAHWHCSCW